MDEEKILYIKEQLGVSLEVAQRLLEDAQDDTNIAKKIYDESEINESLVIFGDFFGKRKGVSGLIYLEFGLEKLKLKYIDVFSSYNNKMNFDLKENIGPNVFLEIVKHYKYESDLGNENETLNIFDSFKTYFHPGVILELYSRYRENKLDEIKNMIISQMTLTINEIALMNISILKKIDILPVEEEEKENYLEAVFEHDHLNGKEVYRLKKGDKVVVKITDGSEFGRYIAKTIGARNILESIPIVREVQSIGLAKKKVEGEPEYRIVINVVDDIYAMIKASGTIRVKKGSDTNKLVKKIEKEMQNITREEKIGEIQKKFSRNIIFFSIMILFLMFLFIIFLVIMTGGI